MQPGRIFFLVNAKSKANLLDDNLILLFGTIEYFKKNIIRIFPSVISDHDGVLTIKTENSILKFYYGSEEVIEKFVMVDVLMSDNPFVEIKCICLENNWLLYDLEYEKYIEIHK
jgi:hypothetical protein